MKRILLLSLISVYIYAGDLNSYNLSIIKESNQLQQMETTIAGPGNINLSVISESKLTLEQEDLIGRTFQTFFNWSELNIISAKLVFEDRRLSILFKLSDLTYKDIEVSQYMPSGIQLYYDTFYEYDFRMFKDGLFMRLKGQYYSKEEFLEELYNAVIDPILYVQIHDPSYIIRQINSLRTLNLEQDNKLRNIMELYSELLDKHNNLKESHRILQSEQKMQTDIQDKLKDGIISLNNKSFFGSLNSFDRAYIDQVIDIKENNPLYSVKEVITELKGKDIKISSKIVEGVFIIYFNEFPQNE